MPHIWSFIHMWYDTFICDRSHTYAMWHIHMTHSHAIGLIHIHMTHSHDTFTRMPKAASLMNLSWHTYMRQITVMSHMIETWCIWMGHVTYERVTSKVNVSYHIHVSYHICVETCRVWKCRVTYEWMTHAMSHMNEWLMARMNEWLMAHMHEAYSLCEGLISHTWVNHVAQTSESCRTREWVMSHM